MDDEGYEAQKAQWEAYADKELAKGICPHSGERLSPAIDWWGWRMLMCTVCDCFGYPLVMSDYRPPPKADA